jgi:hypothetical protein
MCPFPQVLQAVYQGRTDLLQILYDTSLQRAREGWGLPFQLRDKFFPSRITLLHMAAHDGQLDMSRWILHHWDEEKERDPTNSSGLNDIYHAEVEDGLGQTPLFWTFARGTVSVDLARFFVEERRCNLFRVYTMKTKSPRTHLVPATEEEIKQGKPKKKIVPANDAAGKQIIDTRIDGYCSAFSLAIQLAPDFVVENLAKKARNEGSRFSAQIMRFDFAGITLRPEQITKVNNGHKKSVATLLPR